jgi:LmbE family N-acetylglucosaminyl deacetylase
MLTLDFFTPTRRPKILCLGAHPDDIEIGCAATILKLASKARKAEFYWVIFSGNEQRKKEATQSAETLLANVETKTIVINNFRESYFPFVGDKIKDCFEELKDAFCPDIVFTHYRNDSHQDHRLISNLTWNTFRDNLILEYEVPKYDGDLSTPNLYVHITDSAVRRKTRMIVNNFHSQTGKEWFSEETFQAIMRIRGIESNSPSQYAEAFYCRKIIF